MAKQVICQWPASIGDRPGPGCLFKGRTYYLLAKWRHTIMLPRQCGARLYADYLSESHRWHIHGLPIALRAVLCAAIFTEYGCR